MKKYVNKLKRIVAVILSMALVISLFQSDMLRTFADESVTTPVLDFIPEGATLEENKMNEPYPVVYVKNNEITLYADFAAGAQGAVYTGAQGEQIDLANSYTYTTGEEKVILYQYTWHDTEGVMYTAYSDYFRFISADDISFTEVEKPETAPAPTPEVTASPEITPNPTPEVMPTATPGATQAPVEGTITLDFVPNDTYANNAPATEKYAVINDATIRVYKSPDYQAEGVELTVNAGTVIELVTAYTYSDGQVVYRYDYNGVEDSALYNAALSELSGYPIIPAKYITVGVETVENTTITDPDTFVSVTGLLPKTAELDTVPTTLLELPEGTDTTDINENALFYDFTLSNGGAYFEPSSTVKVTFPEKNLNFAQGTEYTIYHVADNGEVTTLGIETYAGGDIQVDVNGFSYIGLSADVEFVDIEDFKAQFKVNPVTLYADTALKNYKEFTTTDTDIITIEMKAIVSDGNNEVELYVIAYNGYEGQNSEMKEAITPSNGMAYAYVKVGDVNEYVESDEQPEEVVNAYENLIKAPTAMDFENRYYEYLDSEITDYFTSEQWSEIERVGNILSSMAETTEYWEEYELEGEFDGKGKLLYLNPITHPEVYVQVNTPDRTTFEFDENIDIVDAEKFVVEGKYTAENGAEYYIIDTSAWAAFANMVPYKYVLKDDLLVEGDWTVVNKKGSFLSDEIKVYDNTLSTYFSLNSGLSYEFDILFSYNSSNGDGTETLWYVIDTTGWTDANGNKVTAKFVKAENVYFITSISDTTGVIVSGDIPEGATLSVSSVAIADTGLADGIYVIGENSLFYDVTLLDAKGNETQPGAGGITVAFPESAVLASGLAVGDKYHVYHVHDGVVDMSEVEIYNGGDIEMDFSSLSAIGISEVEDQTNLESIYGTASDPETTFTATTVYLKDFVTLYEHFQGEVAMAELTGYANTEIEIYNEIIFTDSEGNVSDFKLYQFAYYGATGTDLYNVLNSYHFISSEGFSYTEIETDTATEELYNKLMATETIEEWDDLSLTIIDEQWDAIYSLEEEKVTTLEEHYNNLPTVIEKAFEQVTAELITTTTVAEYMAVVSNVSEEVDAMILGNFEMHHKLIDHIDTLIADEYESLESATNYTNAAPFVAPVVGSAPLTTYSLLRNRFMSNLLADGEGIATESSLVNTEGVVTNKNVGLSTINPGYYTVTLETYVTGEKVTHKVEKYVPTDIIIVVDQSGSMSHDIIKEVQYKDYKDENSNLTASQIYGNYSNPDYRNNTYVKIGDNYVKVDIEQEIKSSKETTTYNPINTNTKNRDYYYWYGDEGTLYYDDDGTKVKVYVTREYKSGSSMSSKYKYTFTDKNGNVIYTSDNDGSGDRPVDENNQHIQFYYQETTTEYTYDYIFTYVDADGNSVTQTYNADDVVPTGTETTAVAGGKYYYREIITEPRLDALTRALTNFATSVEAKTVGLDNVKGTADDVDHRIAIVGFSSNGYDNTEILTGCTITGTSRENNYYAPNLNTPYYYPKKATKNGVQYQDIDVTAISNANNAYTVACGNALQYMSDAGGDDNANGIYDGVENVNAAIDAITAHGGTNTHQGMDMAVDIFAKNPIPAGEERNRVVILFTDGDVSDSDYRAPAIANAYKLKDAYGATVYTVGIFDDANGTILVDTENNSASLPSGLSNNNLMMHYISNNYENATTWPNTSAETFHKDKNGKYTGKSYYLSAGDSDALNNIFGTISEDVENESEVYELDETTVIKDIVAPNFSVPSNVNTNTIKVYTAETNGMTGTTPIFADRIDVTNNVNVEIDGDTVNVKGFDFAEYWVGKVVASDNSVTYHGKKLIIEFDIPVDEDFIGGNKVKTNGDDSGIYVPDLNEDGSQKVDENGKPKFTLVENFTRPTVDIALKNITAQWQNQNIYRTNNADIKSLFTAATINGKAAATVINGENNAYVDIVFTITGPNGEIAKYTINAGDRFAEGGWNDESKLTPELTADTEYTLSWTVTPIHEGTYGVVSGSSTAKVYVYWPELTFKDETVFYGEDKVLVTDNVSNAVRWKRGSTYSTPENMHGKAPTISDIALEYSYDTAKLDDSVVKTTDDISVNVTKVTLKGTDVTADTSFRHTDCSEGETTADTWPSGAEFVIHVISGELKVSKTVVGVNGYKGPTSSFEFTVDNDANLGMEYTIYYANGNVKHAQTSLADGGKFYIADGEYAIITEMPKGNYIVTESDAYTAYTTTSIGATGTITNTNQNVAAFTNKLEATNLTVSKTVSPIPAGLENFVSDKEFTFTIRVNELAEGAELSDTVTNGGTFKLRHGESVTFTGLPVGATYTVTEAEHEMFDVVTPATGIVTGTLSTTANTEIFINTISVGKLTIVKEVVAPSYVDVSGDTFTFTVTHPSTAELTYNVYSSSNNELVSGNLTFTANTATVVLRDGQYAVIENIPVGNYSVEEVDTAGRYTVTPTGDSGTITPTGATAEFVNTLNLYDLTITKDVNGKLYNTADTFIFNVSGPYGFKKEIVIAGENSVTIKGMPYGEYTVVEDTNWSFRYNATKVTQEVILDRNKNVTIENTPKSDNKWLDSAAYAENIFNIFSHQRITKKGVDKNE